MPTVGQILVNEALPEDLRDYHRVLDKKELTNLLRLVKDKYPDRYKKIEHDLETIGGDAAYSVGSSVSIKDLKAPPEKKAVIADINKKIKTASIITLTIPPTSCMYIGVFELPKALIIPEPILYTTTEIILIKYTLM